MDTPKESYGQALSLIDDYCMDCPDGNDDVCETCRVRKLCDHLASKQEEAEE